MNSSYDQSGKASPVPITLIGDAHGKIFELTQIQLRCPRSIQLGDVGFGFREIPEFPSGHTFIRGNHDDPALARANEAYLGDFGYITEDELFFISGADSIDKNMRIPGVSWWEDEELSVSEFERCIKLYEEIKPRRVISHECPASVNVELLKSLMGGYFTAKGTLRSSRTCQALQTMFEIHQPDLWVFGHYHINKSLQIGSTRFECLGELQTLPI